MFIIISGNPVDGFSYEGPYKTHEDALFVAENFGGDWWIAQLAPCGGDIRDRKTADHIDGYDRDDLGESPDY